MAPTAPRQYVTFSLMREEYALEIQHVREIIECERVTAIPSMPPVVRGVINLRGSVVPVVDLPVKFGFPETALGAGTYIVVVDLVWSGESVRLGLLTSELGRVIDVAAADIKPVPDFGTRIQSEYLRGVGQIDGRFALFLDTERLLSPAELLRITTLDDSQPVADGSKRDASTRGGSARPAGR
jgi:purine-binding chemotaxis protein CheW